MELSNTRTSLACATHESGVHGRSTGCTYPLECTSSTMLSSRGWHKLAGTSCRAVAGPLASSTHRHGLPSCDQAQHNRRTCRARQSLRADIRFVTSSFSGMVSSIHTNTNLARSAVVPENLASHGAPALTTARAASTAIGPLRRPAASSTNSRKPCNQHTIYHRHQADTHNRPRPHRVL